MQQKVLHRVLRDITSLSQKDRLYAVLTSFNTNMKKYNKTQVTLWKLFGKYYIFYLKEFKRSKLKELLLKRKDNGIKCQECGLCCINCPALEIDIKGKKKLYNCKLWEQRELTRCKHFPLHPIQIQIEQEDNPKFKCRYYWEIKDGN